MAVSQALLDGKTLMQLVQEEVNLVLPSLIQERIKAVVRERAQVILLEQIDAAILEFIQANRG